MRYLFFTLFIILGLFLPPFIGLKAETAGHLLISEVKISGGTGKTTDEFVEFYNPTGHDISLSGWQLAKETASGNKYILVESFSEEVKVRANSFFLVAHPVGYIGQARPDAYYSTTNSIASNNAVLVFDAQGVEVDKLGLGTASDFEGQSADNPGVKSLERKAKASSSSQSMADGGEDYFLGNGEDSDDNSADFVLSIPNPQNSFSEPEYLSLEIPGSSPGQEETSENSNGENSHRQSSAEKTSLLEEADYQDVRLNELVCNPEGSDDAEYIEIINYGLKTADLSGWQLGDSTDRRFTFAKQQLDSGARLAIYKKESGISLNNTGDRVSLYSVGGKAVSTIGYNRCPKAKSFNWGQNNWVWSDILTPGEKNIIENMYGFPAADIQASEEDVKVGQEVEFDAGSSSDPDGYKLEFFWSFGDGSKSQGKKVSHVFKKAGDFTVSLIVRNEIGREGKSDILVRVEDYCYSDKVYINELLPSCTPSDRKCEFIELASSDSQKINLAGWQLTDLKRKYFFSDDDFINPGGYLVVKRQSSGITLNNGGDIVYLIDPRGQIVSGVKYDRAKKDYSFSRTNSFKAWKWTSEPTPGEENSIIVFDESEDNELEVSSNGLPIPVAISDIEEGMVGKLIKVVGEVESSSSRGIYLMDELGNQIRVYIQKKANIPKLDIKVGDKLEVAGKLDKTQAGLRLLPQKAGDIVVKNQLPAKKYASHDSVEEGKVLGASIDKQIIQLPPAPNEKRVKKYLLATIGLLLLVVIVLAGKIAIIKKNTIRESASSNFDPVEE